MFSSNKVAVFSTVTLSNGAFAEEQAVQTFGLLHGIAGLYGAGRAGAGAGLYRAGRAGVGALALATDTVVQVLELALEVELEERLVVESVQVLEVGWVELGGAATGGAKASAGVTVTGTGVANTGAATQKGYRKLRSESIFVHVPRK
ncbi:hypothetical protein DVH05_016936 [Phytophthora capsici]|nr:hypothetical protein DVH05_016936 [Phytophthora capsici]